MIPRRIIFITIVIIASIWVGISLIQYVHILRSFKNVIISPKSSRAHPLQSIPLVILAHNEYFNEVKGLVASIQQNFKNYNIQIYSLGLSNQYKMEIKRWKNTILLDFEDAFINSIDFYSIDDIIKIAKYYVIEDVLQRHNSFIYLSHGLYFTHKTDIEMLISKVEEDNLVIVSDNCLSNIRTFKDIEFLALGINKSSKYIDILYKTTECSYRYCHDLNTIEFDQRMFTCLTTNLLKLETVEPLGIADHLALRDIILSSTQASLLDKDFDENYFNYWSPLKVNSNLKKTIGIGLIFSKNDFLHYHESGIGNILLPSFKKMKAREYNYSFYIGADYDDNAFSKSVEESIIKDFNSQLSVPVQIIRVKGSYIPFLWNAIYQKSIDNGDDYFLAFSSEARIRDKEWSRNLIDSLPNNFGATIFEGIHSLNEGTYLFVHRTHYSIFGKLIPNELRFDPFKAIWNAYCEVGACNIVKSNTRTISERKSQFGENINEQKDAEYIMISQLSAYLTINKTE